MITRNSFEFYTGDVRFSTCLKFNKKEIEESRALKNGKNVVLAKVKGASTYVLVREVLKDPILQEQIIKMKSGHQVVNIEDFLKIKDKCDVVRASEFYAENTSKIENPSHSQQAQIDAFLDIVCPKRIRNYISEKFKKTTIDDIIR